MKTLRICCCYLLTIHLADIVAATDNELLTDIRTNTSQVNIKQNDYWNKFLNQYLKVNTASSPITPATPGVNATLLQRIMQHGDSMSMNATSDTQSVIDQNLIGSNQFKAYTKPSGAFYGITPMGGDASSPLNASLNVDSILAYDAISGLNSNNKNAERGLPATNFPLLLTQAVRAEPIKRPGEMSEDEYPAYISGVWAENAQISVALSNAYNVLRQREVHKDLGLLAGMKNPDNSPKRDASIMEVEEFLIRKRVGNPDWYTQMENAAPIQIEREQLYVLAEIQRLLHLTRKQNERISMSLSALIAQGVEVRRTVNMMVEATTSMAGDAADIDTPEMPDLF